MDVPFSTIQFLSSARLQQIPWHGVEDEKQGLDLKFGQVICFDRWLIGHDIATGGGELWLRGSGLFRKRARERSVQGVGRV